MIRSNKFCKIACILLLLPLFYINVKDFHDWGDDFAQYLLQARNIVTDKPHIENGLVFDKVDGDFALHAYPAAFPLIIAPIYYFFELSIQPYLILITLFMIGLGWLMFNFFNKYFSPLISLLSVLLILYNRYFLWLKDSILSDIPFIFFLFLLIQLAERKKATVLFYIVCGILASWLSSIRFVGIASVAALVFDILLHDSEKNNELNFSVFSKKRIRAASILVLSAVSFFFLFNTFIFHIGVNDFFGFYSNSFNKESSTLSDNLKYYYDVLSTVFLYPNSYNGIPGIWVLIPLIGWIINLKKKAGFAEWFFLFYLIIILGFNRNTGGFRFIAPIFPLLIKYTIDIVLLLMSSLKNSLKEGLSILILFVLLTGYVLPLKIIIDEQKVSRDGPYVTTSSEMLAVVKNKIPQNEVVGFYKALVISLYTDHKATYLMTGQSPQQVEDMFLRLNVHYLIVSKSTSYVTDIYDPRMNAYLEKFRDRYNVFWENADYIILNRLNSY